MCSRYPVTLAKNILSLQVVEHTRRKLILGISRRKSKIFHLNAKTLCPSDSQRVVPGLFPGGEINVLCSERAEPVPPVERAIMLAPGGEERALDKAIGNNGVEVPRVVCPVGEVATERPR